MFGFEESIKETASAGLGEKSNGRICLDEDPEKRAAAHRERSNKVVCNNCMR